MLKVHLGATSCEAGENVVNGEEYVLLTQISRQRRQVFAAPLEFDMIAVTDSKGADMDFQPAGSDAGDLFAQEEIRPPAQSFGGIHGIMIGYCDQVHAAPLERLIDGLRVVIAFAADVLEHRNIAHSGMARVDVQIASHAPL